MKQLVTVLPWQWLKMEVFKRDLMDILISRVFALVLPENNLKTQTVQIFWKNPNSENNWLLEVASLSCSVSFYYILSFFRLF